MQFERMEFDYNYCVDSIFAISLTANHLKETLCVADVRNEIAVKAGIVLFEAASNAVIHGGGCECIIEIGPRSVLITVKDNGCGIKDIELSAKEGFSTASAVYMNMGFGAGIGISNIKRYTDSFLISTAEGLGTRVQMRIDF